MTPQQIAQEQARLKQSGYVPPVSSGQPVNGFDQIDAEMAKRQTAATAAAAPNVAQETGTNYMNGVAPMASDFNDLAKGASGGAVDDGGPQGNLGKGVDQMSKGGAANVAAGAEKSSLGVAADAVSALFAPITAPIQTFLKHAHDANVAEGAAHGDTGWTQTPEFQGAQQQLSDWAKAHPDIAQTLSDAFTVGTAGLGSGALDATVGDTVAGAKNAVVGAKNSVVDTAAAAKNAVVGTPADAAAKSTQSTIAAIDPELSGAKAAKAYQQVVTGNRTVTPSGLFTEQSLSPAERTIQVGTRLSKPITLSDGSAVDGITLGKNAVKNQVIMRDALSDTENKLTTALKGDPEINYNADKPTLYESLGKARDNAPNEFRIGENKKVTSDVFAFANKVVGNADDTIEGIRDARTAFDTQAKVQYPNAFNPDGTVNVKTAAGNAVKNARDVINEHLYNTAPAGSDIQKLIGREADIFQSNPAVSAKAAAGAGKSLITKTVDAVKSHPKIVGAAAVSEVGHRLGVPGLPGF